MRFQPSTLNNWIPNGKNRYKHTIETTWDWVIVEFIRFDWHFSLHLATCTMYLFPLTWCACLHHSSETMEQVGFFKYIETCLLYWLQKAWLAGWLPWTGHKIVQWNTIHVDTIWFRWSNMSICFLRYMVPSVIQLPEYNPNSNLDKYFTTY